MKEAKVIHINDGNSVELTNGNHHYAEEMTWAGKMLTMYLDAGYDIQCIIPDYTPTIRAEGVHSFYKTGFTVVFTREYDDNSPVITMEDWERENTMDNPYDDRYSYIDDEEYLFSYDEDDDSIADDDDDYDDDDFSTEFDDDDEEFPISFDEKDMIF